MRQNSNRSGNTGQSSPMLNFTSFALCSCARGKTQGGCAHQQQGVWFYGLRIPRRPVLPGTPVCC